MSAIKHTDLIDFDGIERGLDRLEARNLAMGKSMIGVTQQIKAGYDDAAESLKKLEALTKSINPKSSGGAGFASGIAKDINSAITAVEKYKAALELVADASRLNDLSIAQLRTGLSALKTQYDNLNPTAASYKKDQAQIADQTKLVTQAINAQMGVMKGVIKTVNDVAGTYSKLKRQTEDMKAQLLSLPGAFDMTNGSINKGSAAVVTLITKIQENEAALKAMGEAMKAPATQTAYITNTFNGLSEVTQKMKANLLNMPDAFDKLTGALNKDNTAAVSLTAKIHENEAALKAMSAALRAPKQQAELLAGTYAKLSKETAEMKNTLRNMPEAFNLMTGAINKSNNAAVVLQRQIQVNDNALKKMDASMGNHQRNIGNYSSAFSGLSGSLSGFIAPVLGVATAYEALAKSVQIIDQMSRLKLGLEAVSSGSDQVARRFQFLADLADSTGQDIGKLTDNYINFAGATKNTSLEGAKGDAIFKSFSNTFSALGKSSDVANRGLYAIQQMISKTKVNSEELNQQLAEALPGANKIFADAVGVSTAKLADMLKKGEVLAVDVLPKVAKKLEEVYGDRAQKNVETISGSFARLTTQFKLFLDNLNKDNAISRFFSGINNGIADAIKGLNSLTTNMSDVKQRFNDVRESRNGLEKWWSAGVVGMTRDMYNAAQQVSLENEKIGKSVAKVMAVNDNVRRINIINQEAEDLKKMKKAYDDHLAVGKNLIYQSSDYTEKTIKLKDAIRGQTRYIEALGKAYRDNFSKKPEKVILDEKPEDEEEKKKKAKRQLTEYEKLIKEAEKLRSTLVDDLLGDAKAGRPLEVSDDSLASWNKLYQLISKVAFATGDQIPSNLRELNDKLNKVPVDIASQIKIEDIPEEKEVQPDKITDLTKYNALLEVHEKEIENLQERLLNGSFKKFSDGYGKQLQEQLLEIQKLEKDAALAQTEQEKQGVNERIALAKQEFDEKVRLAREEVAIRKEIQQEIAALAVESVNALFQIQSDQRAADLEANQAAMNHELSLVEGNEEAQDRIRKQYAKKELEIRQRQARAEKAQAAFSIAISTITAVAKASPVVPLMVLAAAIGAVQLAAVLAKPIPQFYKGTKDAPEGLAQVAERGPEIRESKGKMTIYKKPTVAYLKKGDKIYTASETQAMLDRAKRTQQMSSIVNRTAIGQHSRDEILRDQMIIAATNTAQGINYDQMTASFVKAIESRPIEQSVIDERGLTKRIVTKNGTTTYLGQRFSLK